MKTAAIPKTLFALALLAGVVASQYAYDADRLRAPVVLFELPSPDTVRLFDLGLHAAAASFFWVNDVIFELPYLRLGLDRFKYDLGIINTLDPRLGFPYYFTILILPNTDIPGATHAALEIGERGVQDADPDWRIPFFLAIAYHLHTEDRVSAARNYDLAARSPNIPFYAERFSENYGIATNVRAETIAAWKIIAGSTNDKTTKERAKAYIERLTIFDLLEEGARAYKQRFGKFPASPRDLVTGGILKEVPPDPFGFEFTVGGDGSAGIVK